MDLDYFFAQVEEIENPQYSGRPLVVCVYSGRAEDSGVVSSANYIARKYMVKAGMPIKMAKRLLPSDAVFLPMRLEHYISISNEVMSIVKKYSSKMQVESIDEAVLDITETVGGSYERAEQLAYDLKAELEDRKSLKCSIGIAPNRIVAKMAAEVAKPGGIKIVRPEDLMDFLESLPLSALPGIGSKGRALLEEKGIKTIKDLTLLTLYELERVFGEKKARYIYLAARGQYDEPIGERRSVKQVSKIITLKQNTRELETIVSELSEAVNNAMTILETHDLMATRIGVIAITSQLKPLTKQAEIRPGAPYEDVIKILKHLLSEILSEDPKIVLRRVGVRFFGLKARFGQTKLTRYTE